MRRVWPRSIAVQKLPVVTQRKAPAKRGLRRICNTVKEHWSRQRGDAPKARAEFLALPGSRLLRQAVSDRGFTIVEVMITLAISGVILTASITIFNGRRAGTEFQQTMYDLQSKFQSYESEASTSTLPADNYVCAENTSPYNGELRPYLTPSTPTNDSQSNQACIYLGKAIQVIPGGDTIYSYPVLGLRTTSSGDFPTSSAQASPDPALDITGKNWYLVGNYVLLNNAQVVSARFAGSTTEQDFLAMYASLQNSNVGNQAQAFSRDITFSPGDNQSTKLRDCVDEVNCGTATPLTTAWNLCVQDNSGTRKAELSLKASSTGVTLSLNMAGCS